MVYIGPAFILELSEWEIRSLKNQKKYPEHLHCYCEAVTRALNHNATLFKCCKCDDSQWEDPQQRLMLVERRLR